MSFTETTYNPRWVLWLKTLGSSPDQFQVKDEHGDSARIPHPSGGLVPWGIVFSEWIRGKWHTWATELGFERDGFGNQPHEIALTSGYTPEDFDRWLEVHHLDR